MYDDAATSYYAESLEVAASAQVQKPLCTLLDRMTRDGDQLRIECNPYEPENARDYRVHFLQNGGSPTLFMLVRRAKFYVDTQRRPHRAVIFDDEANHSVDIDILTMQATYHSNDERRELIEKPCENT